jgi:hypothetical protein
MARSHIPLLRFSCPTLAYFVFFYYQPAASTVVLGLTTLKSSHSGQVVLSKVGLLTPTVG